MVLTLLFSNNIRIISMVFKSHTNHMETDTWSLCDFLSFIFACFILIFSTSIVLISVSGFHMDIMQRLVDVCTDLQENMWNPRDCTHWVVWHSCFFFGTLQLFDGVEVLLVWMTKLSCKHYNWGIWLVATLHYGYFTRWPQRCQG